MSSSLLGNNWSPLIVSLLNVKIKFKTVGKNDSVAEMLRPNFLMTELHISHRESKGQHLPRR